MYLVLLNHFMNIIISIFGFFHESKHRYFGSFHEYKHQEFINLDESILFTFFLTLTTKELDIMLWLNGGQGRLSQNLSLSL